jgi:hypothetical protein
MALKRCWSFWAWFSSVALVQTAAFPRVAIFPGGFVKERDKAGKGSPKGGYGVGSWNPTEGVCYGGGCGRRAQLLVLTWSRE